MTLQTSVNAKQSFAVAGSIYDNSPKRVTSYIVGSNGDAPATVGYAFTYESATPSQAKVSGTGNFAGILVNAKEYANYNNLNASMVVADGTNGELMTFGHVGVVSAQAFQAGYLAIYNTTTGAIGANADDQNVPAGYALIPNAKFILVNGGAGETGVIELTN